MSVAVTFCGIMLYITKKDGARTALDYVLIPECENAVPPFSEPGRHLDGSPAFPHYAGIVVEYADSSIRHWSIGGALVRLSDTADAANVRAPDFTAASGTVASLHDAPSMGSQANLQLNAHRGSAARIDFGLQPVACGSRFLQVPGYDAYWPSQRAPRTRNPHHYVLIDPAGALTITIARPGSDTPETVDLTNATHVFIYNFDVKDPRPDQLLGHSMPNLPLIIDHDFKWLYALVSPKTGDLTTWSDGYLPAPRLKQQAIVPRLISVSTCWPAWF